jgi:tripartite-type tricarboxylate transporter receptor subunit TctC
VDSWVGVLAPAGLPPAIATRLTTELNAVLNDAEAREKLRVLGIEATPGSAAQFRDEMARDLARYGQVVKAAGIKID